MEHVHPNDIRAATESVVNLLGSPEGTNTMEVRLKHADGSWRWVEGTGKNLLHDPKIQGIVCNYRDVTERKLWHEHLRELNQQLEERVQERTAKVEALLLQKNDFISQLGHDLKSPLTPILALLPMMREQVQDERMKEMLDMLLVNANFIRQIVTKTLTLAKLNSDVHDCSPTSLNLAKEIVRALNARAMMAAQKGITTDVKVDNCILVHADKLNLAELLDKLIGNALKFTPKGGSLSVTAETEGDRIRVSVADTGIGMTEDQLSHAFEEFYKADPSRHDLGSSGLGLSICKRIVEQQGGRIWAESPGLGQGSTLHFTLGHAQPEAAAQKR
jgi:PAS domain S-box-containing protein